MLLHHAGKKNIGVLAIRHDSALLDRVCDRVLDMKALQEPLPEQQSLSPSG